MRLLILSLLLLSTFYSQAQTADDFVYNVEVAAPRFNSVSYFVDLTSDQPLYIDWGDGQHDVHDVGETYSFHQYPSAGVFQVIISGNIKSMKIAGVGSVEILQWGSSQFLSLSSAFEGASPLMFNAPDTPDTSLTTDFSYTFRATDLLSPIGNWDFTSAISMQGMFKSSTFNQSINHWDVSNVENMSEMFSWTSDFNQPLNSWDVANVLNMSEMFYSAQVFNQNLSSWNVSSVLDLSGTFKDTEVFNQNLDGWDVSQVTSFSNTFSGAVSYNQLLNWDVGSGIDFSGMFSGTIVYNQPLNHWDMSSARDLSYMFYSSRMFNQSLDEWDVSNVRDMESIFSYSIAFNSEISSWDVSSVSNLYSAFFSAYAFDQNIDTWEFRNSTRIDNFFAYSNLSPRNLEAILRRFLELGVTAHPNAMNGFGLEYCDEFLMAQLSRISFTLTGSNRSSSCINNITGSIIYDQSGADCASEGVSLKNFPLRLYKEGQEFVIYSDANGNFGTFIADGDYTLEPIIDPLYYDVNPNTLQFTIDSDADLSIQDFCITPLTTVDDLEITLLPLEDARPGFETTYKLIYQNNGNTVLSGDIEFNYDERLMTYSSSTPAFNSSTIRTLNWAFFDLAPFEVREILVSFTLNTPTDANFPLNSGDVLGLSGTISHPGMELTPRNNRFDLKHEVVNSFDPNDKTCLQGNVIAPEMVGEYVHYRIRFENEGTASAVNVRIVDYIDLAKFDITTLTPLSSSHDYTAKITEGNKVEFIFDDIQLPFTAPASQGYVLFKIKTVDTLVLGDDFSNQAEIYFDFNFPIITNLETTAVDVTASVADHLDTSFQIIPNPASNQVQLSAQFSFNKVTVFDSLGNLILIKQQGFDATSASLDISTIASGLYFVQLDGGSQGATQKLIVK